MNGYYWRLKVGHKYDPSQPRVPAGDPRGGQWTSTGGASINWSRENAAEDTGLVPVQKGKPHYYRTVYMDPADFLKLATPMYDKPGTLEYLEGKMKSGAAMAPPWLAVTWDEDNGRWLVDSHEGRHRATAAMRLGAKEIPVDLVFNRGWRAKDFTDEMMHSPLQRQDKPDEFMDPITRVEKMD
jgi:hypothetical protein